MLSNMELASVITAKRLNNTKLVRELLKREIMQESEEVLDVTGKRKKEVRIRYCVTKAEGRVLQLEDIDIQVLNAVYTLQFYHVLVFTIEQLASIIFGKFTKKYSSKILDKIRVSITKMQKIEMVIDARDEYKAYPKLVKCEGLLKGSLLPLAECEGCARNGKKTYVYEIKGESVLMKYASDLGYIVQIDIELYKSISAHLSYEQIGMCEKLLQQLIIRNNPKNHMNKNISIIDLDRKGEQLTGVVGSCLALPLDKRKAQKAINIIEMLLPVLKEKGLAIGYELAKEKKVYQSTMFYKVKLIKRTEEKIC